jgi:hypothetical protein
MPAVANAKSLTMCVIAGDLAAAIRCRQVSAFNGRRSGLFQLVFSNCIDLSRMADGEILPIAYYRIVSASRNELTVVAERPEILGITARAESPRSRRHDDALGGTGKQQI